MTYKALVQGKQTFTNAALASGTSEIVTLYAVPASKKTILTEIIGHIRTTGTSNVSVFILKSGGANPSVAVGTTMENRTLAEIGDAQILHATLTSNGYQKITCAVSLNAGDKICMILCNSTAGVIDGTNFGWSANFSGDET